jgi:surface antigen
VVLETVTSRSVRSRAFVLLTMTAVGGLFGVVALPAYAFQEADHAVADYAVAGAQSVTVDAFAASAVLQRDAFTATTPEELAAKRAEEARAALAAARYAQAVTYTAASGPQAGDDYPFRGTYGLSPLGYYGSECVDFVAWRLNRDQGHYGPFRWTWSTLGAGSAGSWINAWYANGRTVSMTPIPGAVAVTNSNHVAYVRDVYADGTVFLEEYNRNWDNTYSTRIIQGGAVLAYLYPP